MRKMLVVLLALAATALPVSTEPAVAAPGKWTTRVFAQVPAPGRPAYVHVHTNGRVYAANYEAGADTRRSRVFEWTAGGALLRSWTVPGQRLDQPHGVQVATQTHDGRLVLLETSTRRVLTLDLPTGRFRRIATLPAGAKPNYATWTPRGLVVTDYAQGVLWRVTRTGRVGRFFASPSLAGVGGFGTTGIAYRPRRGDLLITQQTAGDAGAGQGFLYSLPLRDGRPGRLRTLWTSQPTDLPDGFGIGRSGRIYVANAGLTNQLVQLSPAGVELDRFPDAPLTGDNGSSIPFDTPCSATFLGTSVLVANQSAVQQDASHMAILRVHVGERGRAPYLPRTATFG